jgi:hypothetical protein
MSRRKITKRRRLTLCVTDETNEGGNMERQTFTVRELAEYCTGGNIMAMAKMLNDAGNTPGLCEGVGDPAQVIAMGSQEVSRVTVIDLYAMRSGDRVGRKLAGLLAKES